MIGRAALVAGLVLAAPVFAGAADPAAAVAVASARVAGAGVGLEAARAGGEGRVVALGAAVEDYEAALSALRAGVAGAAARERALTLGLATRRQEIARLVATLQTMSRTPPTPGLHPEGPLAAARAAAMMERIGPALRDQADTLAAALADIGAIAAVQARGRGELEAGLGALAAAQGELAAAMAEAAPMAEATLTPALATMARESETLTELARALAAAGGTPAAPAAAPEAAMAWPVRGEVLRGFNEPDAAGVRRPGVVLRAAPLSLVRAPADAVVRYAGPFLEYGYVVVLEPAQGTMVVLAGLAQLQAPTGAAVRRGEPLGLLGGRPLAVEEYVMLPLSDTGAGGGETLYIEARQGQGPVDPEPLFAEKEQDGLP